MRVAIAVKNRFFVPLLLVMTVLAVPGLITSAEAKTYRWVDENGHAHYSDQLPPQDVNRAYSIMNGEGVTVDKVGKKKTKEQIEEEARFQQKQKEQAELIHQKALRDHILLDTYSQVSDLENTRDRYISTLEGVIKVAQHKLDNLNSDLEKLQKNANSLKEEGRPLPDYLNKDIANLQAQINRENSFIQEQRTQQSKVRDKFAEDIQRFKELKGEKESKK